LLRLFNHGIEVPMFWQLLSATERDSIVASHLRAHLPSLGLSQLTARSWIDGSRPPARRLFEIALLKGAAMHAQWGFSLDFVPHISAGWVRWHRSDKTARLDLVVDPRGLPRPSSGHGPDKLEEGLSELLPKAAQMAQESWRRGSTFSGMLEIICEIRDRSTNRFGYFNYTQLPLAYAFLCAKTGELKSATDELERLATTRDIDEVEKAKLMKLAREYAEEKAGSEKRLRDAAAD
jgi:hypothetical protein